MKKGEGFKIFCMILMGILAVTIVIDALDTISTKRRITANEDNLIAADVKLNTLEAVSSMRGQRMLKLEEEISELEGRIRSLEGKGIFWIVRTGKEVVVLTADGQELRCYFPDDKTK